MFATWAILLCLAIAFQLGSRPLFDDDEGRNAEAMREMSVSGDFFVPHFNGLLFLDKPFLYFAAGGLAMKVFGVNEVAARLPGVLCTILLACGVGAVARRWWGRRAGVLAGIAAAAAPLPLVYSQMVIFDAMLTLWICAAVAALYLAVEREPATPAPAPCADDQRGSFRYWSAVAWAAMGLGVVTKGPVALLVPLAAVLPWALWRRRAGRLVERGAPLALLVVIVPWVFLVSRADPHFLRYALVTETWSRLTSNELKRDAPAWYYLPVVLFGALPWSVAPLAGWRRIAAAWRARESAVRFLVLWFVVPFLLFSGMHSKRAHYILALVPALVLLSIWLWVGTPRGERLPGVRVAAALWSTLGLGLLAVGLGAAPQLLAKVDGPQPATVVNLALALGAAWSLAGLFGWTSSRALLPAFCALTLPPVALLLLTAPLAAELGKDQSSRELARLIESDYAAGIEVVAVETFPASLPFYLGHPLVLMSVDGATLRSNYILRRHSQMVDDAGPLRSPSWLAGAMADCRTPRLFLVWHQDDPARAQLAATGRPMRAGGRNRFLFGLCPDAPATAR